MAIGAEFDGVIAAARHHEPWALERLYRDLAPMVLGYLRVQGARDPEDVASEVFVSLVRGVSRFEGDERQFHSWMFTIVHSRLNDERRKLARRRTHLVAPEELPGVAAGDDPDDEAIARADAWARRLLAGLTPDQRTVVVLRILADLPVAEVARITGKRAGAVKTLQRRALRALRRELEREHLAGRVR